MRFNMPFGRVGAGEFGTTSSLRPQPGCDRADADEHVLGKPPGNHDRILDFSTALHRQPVLRTFRRLPRRPSHNRLGTRPRGIARRTNRGRRSLTWHRQPQTGFDVAVCDVPCRLPQTSARSKEKPMSNRTFVIVGRAWPAQRRRGAAHPGFDGRVVLLGAEPERPYERPPLTKDYLRGSRA